VTAFRVFTQHQTPPKVLPPDIREALGPLAEKKAIYYVGSSESKPIASYISPRSRIGVSASSEL
jgi:hypothetical protein